ncbi:hypothetical protein M011DRAFT_521762 [Sporormia fimetaria CBS 119925]|uniref:Uncharacterized protein n=1 Tax=Sporormia fimetaria CBS 119925 TaxID=1340428 RepID=A0A6A6UYG9_9PLEO|nr:hypothetical protein M011DRAFT_521762 [Sporormia fimetaria CBS 119925]
MVQVSSTAVAIIATGVGVAIFAAFIVLVVLFIRDRRRHKQLLADLEERGLFLRHSQQLDCKPGDTISRPRAVLRRNTVLPFNARPGWGVLPSTETLDQPQSVSTVPHYVPPKPAGFVNRSSRLSWPFSRRRGSGKAFHLCRFRTPALSTVIESPKPSPLIPILTRTSLTGDAAPGKSNSRPSSDQSLLRHHPAFRNGVQDTQSPTTAGMRPIPMRRSWTAKATPTAPLYVRTNRSHSIGEVPLVEIERPLSQLNRPQPHGRSPSICSQSSGKAPRNPVPPLPLGVARLKTQEQRKSLLSRTPSHISVSSHESVGSSILATQSSPVVPRSRNLHLHASSAARFSAGTTPKLRLSQAESRSSTITNSSSAQSVKLKAADAVTLSRVSSPSCSPVVIRSSAKSYTPRRQSRSQVTAFGSPEERNRPSSMLRDGSSNNGLLERQISQTSTRASSTRSSNGNPFHWDPAPLSSGKPSALDGSASARKGHRRQNCVRISLAPTILGPPSRSPSPSVMNDIQEESPSALSIKNDKSRPVVPNTRLSRPPSSSIFAPDIKLTATCFRASLTGTSSTLSLAPYDFGSVAETKDCANKKRLSESSIFTIPSFPSPCHGFGRQRQLLPSSPFDALISDPNSSPDLTLLAGRAHAFQTPTRANPVRNFSSPFSTIPEESSAGTNRFLDQNRTLEDTPPCSPKTLRPLSIPTTQFPQYSVQQSTIPEEPLLETIEPAMLIPASQTMQAVVNGLSHNISIPTDSDAARLMMQPLLAAAFPSSPPTFNEQPAQTFRADPRLPGQNSPSSAYSSPSPSPSLPSPQFSPCSPRPHHAELPTPSLDLSNMPTLTPSLCGPRERPAQPLRSSIAKLRRMNSDAEEGSKVKAGRGERRYLRLGREDSIALPGEESYLDELEDGRAEKPNTTTQTPTRRAKRTFEVAKDDTSPTQVENRLRFSFPVHDGVNDEARHPLASPNRYRKRSVLGGIGTPNVNVRIQVQPPSAGSLVGTPGSLYDQDGFLRV